MKVSGQWQTRGG